MRVPIAAYRVQLNPDFGFSDTAGILDYLAALGISDVYAGPIFKARPGSRHGYDIVDPNSLNPELGGETDFRDLVAGLKQRGMAWIQDIVPNHMALDGANAMLKDILERFGDSEFFDYFDIDWTYHPNTTEPRLSIPVLSKPYPEALANGEISLAIGDYGIAVRCRDLLLPLRLTTYSDVLEAAVAACPEGPPPGIRHLINLFRNLAEGPNRLDAAARVKAEFSNLYRSDAMVREVLDKAAASYNLYDSDQADGDMLGGLLEKQVFRLLHWRSGSSEINYRRFFNVARLISLRMEIPAVFQNHHRLVGELLAEGAIAGLRIDHVDGLYDAQGYLSRLRGLAQEAYVVAEKILSSDETLSPHWEVQGTTGYDFLNHVNGVFCRQANSEALESIYRNFTGLSRAYDDIVYENKRMIVETHFQSALRKLAVMAETLCADMPDVSPTGHDGLKQALIGLIACFPVYRTYIGPRRPHPADCRRIEEAADEARRRDPGIGHDLDVLKCLLLAAVEDLDDSDLTRKRLRFVRILQQYTGPVMAKGFEDTVLYIYNRLLSLNEVGGEPRDFGVSLDDFHAFNRQRLAEWPDSMSSTSTHDTKRGEDLRARINVLSEIPHEFDERIRKWRDLNTPHCSFIEGTRVPSPKDEYFLYQTVIGAYPFDEDDRAGFLPRLEVYMVKAMREAKSLTSWAEPDIRYEELFLGFMGAILDPVRSPEFLDDFMGFAGKVHRYGVYNSLSQTLLKMTAPGIPDFYQGAELWDLNLVDPDNRRPVDFAGRGQMLKDLAARMEEDMPGLLRDLLDQPEDGAVKMFLMYRALAVRSEKLALFREGEYIPVYPRGDLGENVICFARKLGESTALILAPRFYTALVGPYELPLGANVWKNTEVPLPEGFPSRWQDAITATEIHSNGSLALGDVLTRFPVALLLGMK